MELAFLPELLAAVLASVIAITLHEAAHGYAALGLGDDTAQRHGPALAQPAAPRGPGGHGAGAGRAARLAACWRPGGWT
jgi:hypothetical protein